MPGRGAPAGRGTSGGRGTAPSGGRGASAGRGGGSSNGHRFHHHYGGGRSAGGVAPAPAQQTTLLPFSAKERSATELISRRQTVPEDLTQLTAHCLSAKAKSGLSRATAEFALKATPVSESTIKPVAAEEPKPGGVSIRAFLAGPIASAGRGHVLHKMPVIAGRSSETGELAAYGGYVAKGKPDATMTASLKKMVKDQSGIDVSKVRTWEKVVTLDYGAKGSTVFFAPNLAEAGGDLAAQSQANETSEEVEVDEKYETEVETEEEKDGKKEKVKKTVKKTRKVKKTKVNKDVTHDAEATSVGALVEMKLSKGTPDSTKELAAAAAAYDEWVQRDAATAIIPILKAKTAEEEKKKKEREAKQEEAAGRKRKRQEALTAVKKSREDQEEKLRATWKEEDEGMTDEEKKQAKKPRADAIAALFKEMQEGVSKVQKEHNEADAAANKKPEADPSKPRTRTVWETDKSTYNLFQLLDRPQEGLRAVSDQIDRNYLARKLLCLESDPASLKDAKSLATLGGNAYGALNYKQLAQVSKEVEIPPEPKEEEEPAKEEKKETKQEEETAES